MSRCSLVCTCFCRTHVESMITRSIAARMHLNISRQLCRELILRANVSTDRGEAGRPCRDYQELEVRQRALCGSANQDLLECQAQQAHRVARRAFFADSLGLG